MGMQWVSGSIIRGAWFIFGSWKNEQKNPADAHLHHRQMWYLRVNLGICFVLKLQRWHGHPTSNAEKAEVEWFYEDLHDLLELTPKKDVFFIIGDWNAKVGSQETPGVTGKFDLGVQNESGRRPGMLWFMGLQRVGHDWATELNRTELASMLPWWLSR